MVAEDSCNCLPQQTRCFKISSRQNLKCSHCWPGSLGTSTSILNAGLPLVRLCRIIGSLRKGLTLPLPPLDGRLLWFPFARRFSFLIQALSCFTNGYTCMLEVTMLIKSCPYHRKQMQGFSLQGWDLGRSNLDTLQSWGISMRCDSNITCKQIAVWHNNLSGDMLQLYGRTCSK